MKTRPSMLLLCFALTLASAANGFGQCNQHPFRPSLLPPCPTIGDQLTKAHEAAKEFVRQVDALNSVIGSARSRYWKTFPNGPGSEAAEMAFADALLQKDLHYLQFSLIEGINGRVPKLMNFIDLMGGGSTFVDAMSGGDAYKKFPTNVDDGIKPYAFPLFVGWVDALRRAEGRETDGAMATPLILLSAIKDKSNWRKAYEDARNWAEFMSSGLDIAKYVTPQVYLLRQMEADVCLMLAAAKPADLPDPTAAALDQYNFFVKIFGEKEVLAAAGKVLRAPKNSVGGLAKRADVAIGPYFMSPHPSPYVLFLTEVTNSTPRNYAVALCIDAYGFKRVFSREKWADAFSVYNQVVAKYGEANVLAAATRVKAAPKDSEGRLKGDPQYNGQLYWLDTLIKNPKAELPGGLPHFRAGSYDSRWLGQHVEVRGTVSRVDLAKGQFPPYATIHFKESGALMAYTPNSDMWQETYGENFSGLVGKVVEVFGEVGKWNEGAGVRVIDRDQVKILEASSALGPDFKESRPEWLTSPKPARALVDNPKYLAWKKFPPGTTATYVDRLLNEYQPGMNQYTRTKISRTTFRLDSIDENRAIVTADTTTWHMRAGVASGTSSETRKLTYQAKEPPGQSGETPPNETGQETLEINGKKIATHWETSFGILTGTFAQPDKQKFIKTWTSDEVPGGLVLIHKQDHREILAGQDYRNISETILETVENVEPELGSWSANQVTPGAPAARPGGSVAQAAPPAGQSRSAPTSPTMNQPRAQAAPATPTPQAPNPPQTRVSPTPAPPPQARTSGLPPAFGRRTGSSPAASNQMEFAKHYSSVMQRAARVRAGLNQRERDPNGSGELPESVREARDRLDAQMQAVAMSMRTRDTTQAEQNLRGAEEALTTIEQFLAK